MVNNLPAIWETRVWSLGREDPLEKGMVTHSSILAWIIPQTMEPGELQSIGSQRVGCDWSLNTFTFRSSDGLYLSTELGAINNYFGTTGENKDCIDKIGQSQHILFQLLSYVRLCNPMDCNLPGSSVHGILQVRTLERVVIPFSRGSSWSRNWTGISCIAGGLFTNWAIREAHRQDWELAHPARSHPFRFSKAQDIKAW